ncbi:uncharacterized protein [Brachionichthys hirsutus]|uniref:uncharacterized protein n=1 Tax=Brachionichthys hirsutus TaxID=412623 RepID=UPI00360491DE
MSPWWTFTILVGLCHGLQPENACTCKDLLKTVCVPAGDNVSVPCPQTDGDEVKYNLFHAEQVVYIYKCTKKKGDGVNCETLLSTAGAELHGNAENQSVSITLVGVTTSSYGIYRCEGTVVVPPPMMTEGSDLRVLVLLKGHHCKQVCRTAPTDGEPAGGFLWIGIIASVSIYSVIVTIIAIFISVKLRRTDSQTDYINTKPNAPRGRRKNRGVQSPMPRHF